MRIFVKERNEPDTREKDQSNFIETPRFNYCNWTTHGDILMIKLTKREIIFLIFPRLPNESLAIVSLRLFAYRRKITSIYVAILIISFDLVVINRATPM